MQFNIANSESAEAALEYFNAFHDGFMKRIVLESQDVIDEDHGQSCTGRFDVLVDFAHYNYADGPKPFHPHNQRIRARFHDVQDIALDLNAWFAGNTIIRLSVRDSTRQPGGSTGSERCLSLMLIRHFYLEAERRYELREAQLFTFAHAAFQELPSA